MPVARTHITKRYYVDYVSNIFGLVRELSNIGFARASCMSDFVAVVTG